MAVGLLLIRLVVGLTVASHGVQKLTRRFGGHGVAGTGDSFEQMGFRPGRRFAVLAGLTELGGGLLLATGLLTPLGVAGIVAMMLAAIWYVHLRHGFFAESGGFEYPLVLAVSAAAVALSGPGRYSIDYVLGWNLSGWRWFVAAVGAGVIAAGLAGLSRLTRRESHQRAGQHLGERIAA
ncbi:MAG: DoxX family protein [Acidimicrobiales bacterium]